MYLLHMRGAEERAKADRISRAWLAWNIAFLPNAKKPPKFEELAGIKQRPQDRVAAFHAAWDKIDRALARAR